MKITQVDSLINSMRHQCFNSLKCLTFLLLDLRNSDRTSYDNDEMTHLLDKMSEVRDFLLQDFDYAIETMHRNKRMAEKMDAERILKLQREEMDKLTRDQRGQDDDIPF